MNMTFVQYRDHLIRKCAKEHSCSLKEAEFNFPEHFVRPRHGEACFDSAKKNIILSRDVLDSLLPLQRYRIFHDLPDYLSQWVIKTGKPYINPEVRKESRLKIHDFRRFPSSRQKRD